MSNICIPQAINGAGGIGGGGGVNGQPSLVADGHDAQGYGVPVIHITTGMTADFTVQLTRDRGGTIPASLEDIDKVDFTCFTSGQLGRELFKVDCTNLGEGKVGFTLTPKEVNYRQGLHYAEFHCWKGDILKHVYKCCLQIQKSFQGSTPRDWIPLTIGQVRMALYDTSPQMNTLLDDLQFSDIVIARCIQRAVDDWNEMPPMLSRRLTVSEFPYRSNLCNGAVAHVLNMAALRYNRNQMRHSNAGLTIDDNDKGMSYMQIASNFMQDWRGWVQTKKNQLNMLQCMGSISDLYMQSTQPWW